ncbi:hypothetical protein BDF14DRAFT_1729770 [Spinellus fusiger]|nr:hypothetical protein BDF14DRAFT_1729770 [Spinellus fusiger]
MVHKVNTFVCAMTNSQSTQLNLSVNEAVEDATQTGTFLLHILVMLEPCQVKTNEIAEDAYHKCLKLKDHLSEQLWCLSDAEIITSVQDSIDLLSSSVRDYEAKISMV